MQTVRGTRMLESLPDYYHGNAFVERLVQSLANELDRVEAHAESVASGLIPTQATDDHGLLGAWERLLGLPVEPPAATVTQRQAKVGGRLQSINSSAAGDTVEAIRTAAGASSIVVYENDPAPLVDTIEVPFNPSTYNSTQVEALARRIWPAHRSIQMRYSIGFVLDASLLDQDAL